MAKNINRVPLERQLEIAMENPNASIRKLAQLTETSYSKLLNASRKPLEGQVYDPTSLNYAQMAFVLGAEKIETLDLEALHAPKESRSTVCKDILAFSKGTLVFLRRDNEVAFEVVHVTATHIVIQQLGSETPVVWSHSTFLFNGPALEPRAARENHGELAVE